MTIDDPQSTSGKASLAMATDFKDHASQTTFELLLEGEAFGSELPKMSGFYHTAMDQKSDEEVQQKVDVGIDLDIDDPMLGQQQFHIELHVDKNTAFTDDLSFPGLEADETVHVMETSDAEMQEIGMQIQQNLQGYFGQLLGVFGGM